MSKQQPQQPGQSLNISDSVLENVQIGGIAGRDLNLTQIQGGVGAINVYSSVQVAQAPLSAATSLSREEYQWRRVLLSKVKQFWIDGVLAKSLHTQVLIELGLEERREYIQNPLEEVEEFPSDPSPVFPAGTSATNIFESIGAGRTLLILGEPGAGKTVTLLKLAESLIKRTTNDLSQPLPVVVNLSSWARQRKSIENWLAQELYKTYQISKFLGKAWIDKEQLILLLDGLDEVAAQHRNDCVKALNQFIQEHGRTEMVVCSRIRDYEALSERLRLRSAIYVQPLTFQQIDQYLEQGAEQLEALKTLLNHNAEIKKFASSPLILSIMSLTYQDYALDTFLQSKIADTFYLSLFDSYIERMLTRRGTTQQYSQEQTKHWLIWMAQRMHQTSQTVFLIERLQPTFLETQFERIKYRLESALVIGLSTGIILSLDIIVVVDLLKYWNIFQEAFEIKGVFSQIKLGLFFGLVIGLVTVSLGNIEPVETLQRWHWQRTKQSLRYWVTLGLKLGLGLGASYGLISGLITEFYISTGRFSEYSIRFFDIFLGSLFGGALLGVIVGLCIAILQGFIGGNVDIRNRPNLGIWKSAKNGLIVGVIVFLLGFIYALIMDVLVISLSLPDVLVQGLIDGLAVGSVFGILAGLIGGGLPCLRHLYLRFFLFRKGFIPWNYAHFLDYATERLFLQKVGGGYIFIHRMLLEHFAQMDLE